MDLNIINIERITVDVPFRDVPARNMVRELPHWTIFELTKVTLHCGVVGYGETMPFYTWGRVTEEAVKRAWGKNAATLLWDDSLGAGLQIALFDAVAKSAGVPIYRLLGTKVRDRAPLSWWAYDMSPEDWASECQTAVREGYTAFKTKARPWWDLDAQIEAVSRVVPQNFKIDLDFNSTLLNADHARRVLPAMEQKYSNVAIWETPIPQNDVAGNKAIQSFTRAQLAMHYGSPPVPTALKEDVCDGFVIGGSASSVVKQAAVAAAFNKPFWLQLVGTGITAAFSLHLGAVLSHATWPAVNCHQLYRHTLLSEPIRVEGGTAAIPERPGLGFDIDIEAVKRFRIEPPKEQPPGPRRIVRVHWPNGAKSYYSRGRMLYEDANAGRLPVFVRGVKTDVMFDDGSEAFAKLHERAAQAGFHEGTPGPSSN